MPEALRAFRALRAVPHGRAHQRDVALDKVTQVEMSGALEVWAA